MGYYRRMIIVTGSLTARPETLDALLELSLEHVRRSRGEPGCILHSVQRDAEDSYRLVFFEKWRDLESLRVHFARSGDFVRRAAELTAAPGTLEIFEATAVELPGT